MYNQYQGGKYKNPLEQAKEDYEKFKKDKEWFDFKANEKVAELLKQRDDLNNQLQLINMYGEKYGYSIYDTKKYSEELKNITTELKKSKPLLELYKKNGLKINNVKDFEQLVNKPQLKTIEYNYPYSEPNIDEYEEEEEEITQPIQSNIIIEEQKKEEQKKEEPKTFIEKMKDNIKNLDNEIEKKFVNFSNILLSIKEEIYNQNSNYLRKEKLGKNYSVVLNEFSEKDKSYQELVKNNIINLLNQFNNMVDSIERNKKVKIFDIENLKKYDVNTLIREIYKKISNTISSLKTGTKDINNIRLTGNGFIGQGYATVHKTQPIYSYYSYYF